MAEEKLTEKQRRAVVMLIECATREEAAARAGVASRTIRNWWQNETFRSAVREASRRSYEGALARLRELSLKAAKTLGEAMDGGSSSLAVRAAEAVLTHCQRSDTADLIARLERLEAQQP